MFESVGRCAFADSSFHSARNDKWGGRIPLLCSGWQVCVFIPDAEEWLFRMGNETVEGGLEDVWVTGREKPDVGDSRGRICPAAFRGGAVKKTVL